MPKSTIEVTLREARFNELPTVARILSLAFWNDQIFGELVHPKRAQYPLDSDLYWLRDARINFWDHRYKFIVAVMPDAASPRGEKIVGIAEWERLGQGPKSMQRSRFDPRNLLKPLMSKAMAVHERLYPNRAISAEYGDVAERAYPFFDSVWSGDRAESWYLSFLAVHPDFQGTGVGKKLTLWGLDQAEREGVVASVITALGTEDFYRRCGFNETLGSARDGEGNPIADKQGLDIMWRWPSGSQRESA